MTFGVDGLRAHEEDDWMDRDVRVGEALLRVTGHVGRCAATTRQPDTGLVDFKALHHLNAYRRHLESTEPLPFGVHARVLEPGRVRVGDGVTLAEGAGRQRASLAQRASTPRTGSRSTTTSAHGLGSR
jgi:uncharacterized protein YcbX